jgi:hypothetical protein
VGQGAWSEWLPADLRWQTKNDYNIHTPKKSDWEEKLSEIEVSTRFRINVIRLGQRDYFRVRFLYDGINPYTVQPPDLAPRISEKLGPMVDFVDNYPPQLVYYREDKSTFLAEAAMSLEWHRSAVPFLVRELGSEAVIHSIYTPNQMLTSRWWLPYLDPLSPKYRDIDEKTRAQLWREMKSMYQKIDEILGAVLDQADPDTYIVFSSDHGALPLYREVRLNNLFARKGWLQFRFNPERKEYEVDWEHTRVVFLQMNNIYIHPKGLGGPYRRAEGP